ncbi:MAG: ATP-binding protein [Cocleimonas sp.]|nr:ATP-binding protein [Cocleimonas sp.]
MNNRLNSAQEKQKNTLEDTFIIEKLMVNCSITSDFSEVRKLSSELQYFCDQEQLNSDISGVLELILVEAVNNVIEHAYDNKPGFPIDVKFEAFLTKVVICIKDQGLAVPDVVRNRDAKTDMPNITELPEGGWGLGLIYTLADDIEHSNKNGFNIMIITKKL